MALAVAFLSRVFSFRPLASPGPARLQQALHPVAGRQVDHHERPALFLSGHALHQGDRLHSAADHRADELPAVPDAQDPSAHLHRCAPLGPEYRTSEVQGFCPAVPADCRHRPPNPDLGFRLACAQVAGHVPVAKDGNQAPLSRRVCLAVRGVQMAQVRHLSPEPQALHPLRVCLGVRGVQMAQVNLSRGPQALQPLRVCLSAGRDQMAWANRRARAPEVSLQFFHAHRALAFLVQMAEANQLLAVFRPLQPVDSHQHPALRCPLDELPHELAVECSSDFLF